MFRFLLAVLLLTPGCMAVYARTKGEWSPYIGTASNLHFASYFPLSLAWAAVLDLPMSFLGETAFLPISLAIAENKKLDEDFGYNE